LDLHHEIFLLLLDNQLHNAPIGDTPHRILDVGTGTGIWAVEMADKYPSAEVIGTDLRCVCTFPLNPADTTAPSNQAGSRQTAGSRLTMQSWSGHTDLCVPPTSPLAPIQRRKDTFDFIHVRNLAQATNDFPALVSQAYRCTAPGGYTELAEMGTAAYTEDGCNLADFSGLQRFVDLLHRSMERLGRPAHCTGEMLKEVLETAGFVNVVTSMYKEPSGPWPVEEKLKLAGAMTLLSGQTGFQAYGMGEI
jgi:SAM-dependent methyltransferase